MDRARDPSDLEVCIADARVLAIQHYDSSALFSSFCVHPTGEVHGNTKDPW